MNSEGNDLSILYNAKKIKTFSDYEVSITFINNTYNCGGHYYAETGSIRSPNYPNRYPKNKECIWLITAKNKYVVTVNFKSFFLERSPKCIYDYLEIR